MAAARRPRDSRSPQSQTTSSSSRSRTRTCTHTPSPRTASARCVDALDLGADSAINHVRIDPRHRAGPHHGARLAERRGAGHTGLQVRPARDRHRARGPPELDDDARGAPVRRACRVWVSLPSCHLRVSRASVCLTRIVYADWKTSRSRRLGRTGRRGAWSKSTMQLLQRNALHHHDGPSDRPRGAASALSMTVKRQLYISVCIGTSGRF